MQFPFYCTICRTRIAELLDYFQHMEKKHCEPFWDVLSFLFPSHLRDLHIPDTLTPNCLKDDMIDSPLSSRLIIDGEEPRLLTIIPAGDQSLPATLTNFFKSDQTLFVKPICFDRPPGFGPGPLSLLVIGGGGGLAVVDFVRKADAPEGLCTFLRCHSLLCAATLRERWALDRLGLEVASTVLASHLASLRFVQHCDAATSGHPALLELLQRKPKRTAFARWPAPALSVLAHLAFPLLVLSFLEREGIVGGRPPSPADAPERPPRLPGYAPARVLGLRALDAQCPLCGATARDTTEVLAHLLQAHPEMRPVGDAMRTPTAEPQSISCLMCGFLCETDAQLMQHAVLCHRETLLEIARGVTAGPLAAWASQVAHGAAASVAEKVVDPYIENWRNLCPPEPVGPEGECWF
jgi:hypothetical protein